VEAVVDAEALTEYQEFAMPEPKAPCKMVDADKVKELVHLLQNEAKVL